MRLTRLQITATVCIMTLSIGAALAAAPVTPPGEHPPGCSALAGYVSRELMERPVGLAEGVGQLHQKVSTESTEAQEFYDQGLAYLASYVWVEAARSFEEALRKDPKLAMAQLGLAKAYTGAEAEEDALKHQVLAEELASGGHITDKEKKWIALSRQQMEAVDAPGKKQAALHLAYKKAIEDLIKSDPEDADAWVLRGNAEEAGAWGRGQTGGVASIAYYETALKYSPDHIGAHHFLVHSYENIGKHATAAEHGKVYAEACPRVPHAQHMYGHVLPRLGKWKEAQAQFLKADLLEREYYAAEKISSEEDWHHAHNLHLLGTIDLRLGDSVTAERLYLEAYETPIRDEENGGWDSQPYAEFLLYEGRFEEALAVALKMQERTDKASHLIGATTEGEALIGLGRIDEAKKALRKAQKDARALFGPARRLSRNPSTVTIILEGELGMRGKDPAAAIAELTKYADDIAANPRFDAWGSGIYRLMRVAADARRAGNQQLADTMMDRVKKIDPDFKAEGAPVAAR